MEVNFECASTCDSTTSYNIIKREEEDRAQIGEQEQSKGIHCVARNSTNRRSGK